MNATEFEQELIKILILLEIRGNKQKEGNYIGKIKSYLECCNDGLRLKSFIFKSERLQKDILKLNKILKFDLQKRVSKYTLIKKESPYELIIKNKIYSWNYWEAMNELPGLSHIIISTNLS